MKRFVGLIMGIAFSVSLAGFAAAAGPELTPEMKTKVDEQSKIVGEWVKDPLIVDAVKAQNAENLAMDVIKTRDESWIANSKADTPDDFMKAQLAHPVGEWIREKNKEARGAFPEAFLTDNQGANVAVSKYTSDYWQGDEAKWEKSFAAGAGAVFVGEPEFDPSSKAMQVQVSVPVMDGGKSIGVLVVGLKFSNLK